jgi:surface protein
MFANAKSFNGDISTWDTSQAEDMEDMFSGASIFNGDISSWNTMSLQDVRGMFHHDLSFNRDLPWTTPHLIKMSYAFANADAFTMVMLAHGILHGSQTCNRYSNMPFLSIRI